MSRHRVVAATALASLILVLPLAQAAPIDPSEAPSAGSTLGLPGGDDGLGAGSVGSVGGAGGANDDTVEMLLRLQQSSGLEPAAQPRASARGARGAVSQGAAPLTRETPGAAPSAAGGRSDSSLLPAGVVQELKDLKESVFGSSLDGGGIGEETAHPRRGSAENFDRGGYSDPAIGGATGGGARSAGASPRASGGGLLANPVVRFIRENRGLSIGASLGVLAAVWLTSNYRSRSRSRRRR